MNDCEYGGKSFFTLRQYALTPRLAGQAFVCPPNFKGFIPPVERNLIARGKDTF